MLDGLAVEGHRDLLPFLPEAAYDLGRVLGLVGLVARIDALRAEAEPEVLAFLHAGLALDDGLHEVLGRGRVGRRLEADESPALHVTADIDAGILDEAHVGLLEFVEGGGHAYDECVALLDAREVRGGLELLRGENCGEIRIGDIGDIVLSGFHRFGFFRALFESEDRKPVLGEGDGKR